MTVIIDADITGRTSGPERVEVGKDRERKDRVRKRRSMGKRLERTSGKEKE